MTSDRIIINYSPMSINRLDYISNFAESMKYMCKFHCEAKNDASTSLQPDL